MTEDRSTPSSTDAAADTSNLATSIHPPAHAQARLGVMFGVAAYGFWGMSPIFFKALTHDYFEILGTTIPGLEILAHRIVWSVVLLFLILTFRKQWGELIIAIRTRRTLLTLLITTGLIGLNWYLFIYAVESDRILEAALGYYINPLVNVLLGFVFLRERLRAAQIVALIVAALGVLIMTLAAVLGAEAGAEAVGVITPTRASIPWIALTIAFSFGFYGLLRKVAPVNGVPGLAFETTLLAPIAVGYLLYLGFSGGGSITGAEPVGHFGNVNLATDTLLVAAGLVTIFPLLCFANAARRLRLSTLGFIQYIAPTENFILGIFMFGEAVSLVKLLAFGFIWLALAIYTVDMVKHNRARLKQRDG